MDLGKSLRSWITINIIQKANIQQIKKAEGYFSLTKQVARKGKIEKIVEALLNGTILCVSDGSFDKNTCTATAAWTIQTPCQQHCLLVKS